MRENVCYAGFTVRLCAWLIDMAVMIIPLSILNAVRFALTLSGVSGPLTRALLFRYSALDIAAWLLPVLYFTAMTWSQGATVGKMLLRLEVVSAERGHLTLWQTLLRETVGRYLSALAFIGYWMILPDREKRALHDRVADTRVIYALPRPAPVRTPAPSNSGNPVNLYKPPEPPDGDAL